MRLAIISDIHEDIISLQKVYDQIIKFDIDKIICLGDVIGFESKYYDFANTRSAKKCIQFLQKYADFVVPGNHDLLSIEKLPFYNNLIGFPDNWYTMPIDEREKKYDEQFFLYQAEEANDLGELEKVFIKKLNHWEIIKTVNSNLLFTHFIYPDINGNRAVFHNNKQGFKKHFEWMKELGVNISFVGHTHIEGLGIAKKRGFKINKFGIYSLKDEPQLILCPSIAKGRRKNGFVIFDSVNMTIEAKSLN